VPYDEPTEQDVQQAVAMSAKVQLAVRLGLRYYPGASHYERMKALAEEFAHEFVQARDADGADAEAWAANALLNLAMFVSPTAQERKPS
jgi:hypothetical protein